MKRFLGVMAAACGLSGGAVEAAGAPQPQQPSALACSGPEVVAGRKIVKADGLPLGLEPGACFAHMNIYGGQRQIVVVAPSTACPGGKQLEVYGQSNAGSWYAYFEHPVCGASVTIGPKDPWGDWMLTVDGRQHYDSRGAFYIPVN